MVKTRWVCEHMIGAPGRWGTNKISHRTLLTRPEAILGQGRYVGPADVCLEGEAVRKAGHVGAYGHNQESEAPERDWSAKGTVHKQAIFRARDANPRALDV